MQEIAKQFGRNLHVARWEAGISQGDLAALVFIDRGALSRLEHGHRLPRLDLVVRLAQAIGVEVGDLLYKIG